MIWPIPPLTPTSFLITWEPSVPGASPSSRESSLTWLSEEGGWGMGGGAEVRYTERPNAHTSINRQGEDKVT